MIQARLYVGLGATGHCTYFVVFFRKSLVFLYGPGDEAVSAFKFKMIHSLAMFHGNFMTRMPVQSRKI